MQGHDSVIKGVAMALLTALLSSSSAALGKYTSASVLPTTIVFIQYLVCVAVMLPWLYKQKAGYLRTAHLSTHLIRGLSGWACFFAYFYALKHTPLVDASLLRNTAPLFVPLVAWIWLRVVVPGNCWIPMISGFAGVILILQPAGDDSSIWHSVGLMSGITLSVSMLGTRVLSATEPQGRILFYYFFISLICSAPFAIYYWQPIPPNMWIWLVLIGLSIWVMMWCYTKAYSYAKPSIISPVSYMGVVFAGLTGWYIWNHTPDSMSVLGMVVVMIAGIISVVPGTRKDSRSD